MRYIHAEINFLNFFVIHSTNRYWEADDRHRTMQSKSLNFSYLLFDILEGWIK